MQKEIREFVKTKLSVVSDQDIDEEILTGGRSGSDVYSIKVKSRRPRLSGYYIVKVCPPTVERDESEADKARQFYNHSPKFSEHLVKYVDRNRIDGKGVIIYQQANQSRLHATAFSVLDAECLARYTRRVSRDILSVLNQDIQTGGTVEDFFRYLLNKQLGEGGRFTPRMRELLDRPDAECVALGATVYPNPFYFMTHIDCWSGVLPNLLLYKGAVHGDLHGLNLIASEESEESYSIIDYDSASMDSYLLFDQAYFEFSVFFDNAKDNDLKPWSAMLEQLVIPSVFQQVAPCEHYLEYMVRNAVCAGITDWVQEAGLENSRDDIELQFLLARIAAGINFFCKKNCADQGKQIKVLLFICCCLKSLFETIGYSYNTNDVCALSIASAFTDTEDLWENVFKFRNYIPVLITDDHYTASNLNELKNLCSVRWSLVVDVGPEEEEPVVYKSLLEHMKTESVKRIALLSGENAEAFDNTLNVLSIQKPAGLAYANLWRRGGKRLLSQLEKLLSSNPQVPLVLVFDCSKNALPFRNRLIDRLCDLPLPGATRFAALRAGFSEDFVSEMEDLESKHHWHFVAYPGATLLHAAKCCGLYLQQLQYARHSAELPSVDGTCTFSKEDLLRFSPSIELVYAGCEDISEHELGRIGFDTSGGGDSLGEEFYKGGEATWSDIAKHRALRLLEDRDYQNIKNRLEKLMDESSPRIKTMRLIHGAGTGGTTLSKRILWDLKQSVPCVRLKKYVPVTVSMLLEVCKKTGKRVLMTVEQGSTVITDDELNILAHQVNAENGKLLILLITRSTDPTTRRPLREEREGKDVLVRLIDTMPARIARDFLEQFSKYAAQRSNPAERVRRLEAITGDDDNDQRTPFFYGFYAFQEEYNLLDRLQSTVAICTQNQRELLNCLALVTAYSQNICVAFSELPIILDMEDDGSGMMNLYVMKDNLPTAISKLMVIRPDGCRLCHPIIAEKLLLLLHSTEDQHAAMNDVVYPAICSYVQTLYNIYRGGNDRVDKILKELVIDRAYIDADDKKTKLSPLVEAIPKWRDKEALFRLLIEKFPENPHYYNHLARLLAFGDVGAQITPQYEAAVEEAEQAIKVAERAGVPTPTHRTTLGCIYGQWLIHNIREATRNKLRGRFAQKCSDLIDDIKVLYSLAREEFEHARKESEIHDSFNYFPQIHMEYQIIEQLIEFDHGRTIQQLIAQEPSFKAWYDEHFSIATELMLQMRDLQNNNPSLLKQAREGLGRISENSLNCIKADLRGLLNSNAAGYKRRRRALIYGAFVTNGCQWNGLDKGTCELAEESLRNNFIDSDDGHKNADVETWFELYRRCSYFNAAEAQHILAAYMEDGYKKNYLLFLLAFILWESGAAGASPSAVDACIREAQLLARQYGVNTAREHDCFVGTNAIGCPIVPVTDIRRDGSGNPEGLKTFTGRVTEVEYTHGKILLDRLNLEVTFIPNPTTVNQDEKRIFKRENVSCRVKLNLMFSYSGLRGWDVVKQD